MLKYLFIPCLALCAQAYCWHLDLHVKPPKEHDPLEKLYDYRKGEDALKKLDKNKKQGKKSSRKDKKEAKKHIKKHTVKHA